MKPTQKLYLGVEGGATKSTLILVDEKDKIRLRSTGKALNYHALGKNRAKQYFKELLKPVLVKTKQAELYAVFALAGVDSKKDAQVYQALVKPILPRTCVVEFVNDSEGALEARCHDAHNRILVISGTGSNVFGESGDRFARSVGWDFILGDQGSGYDFGLKVVRAAMRSYDGRSKKTMLEKLVLKKTRAKKIDDFIPKVYETVNESTHSMKYYIASFAPLLDEAIKKKDATAIAIRNEAVTELVLGVTAVVKRLNIAQKSFCLAFMGSTWKMPGFQTSFKKEIKQRFPKVSFSQSSDSGAWGTILLAKKLATTDGAKKN